MDAGGQAVAGAQDRDLFRANCILLMAADYCDCDACVASRAGGSLAGAVYVRGNVSGWSGRNAGRNVNGAGKSRSDVDGERLRRLAGGAGKHQKNGDELYG